MRNGNPPKKDHPDPWDAVFSEEAPAWSSTSRLLGSRRVDARGGAGRGLGEPLRAAGPAHRARRPGFRRRRRSDRSRWRTGSEAEADQEEPVLPLGLAPFCPFFFLLVAPFPYFLHSCCPFLHFCGPFFAASPGKKLNNHSCIFFPQHPSLFNGTQQEAETAIGV